MSEDISTGRFLAAGVVMFGCLGLGGGVVFYIAVAYAGPAGPFPGVFYFGGAGIIATVLIVTGTELGVRILHDGGGDS